MTEKSGYEDDETSRAIEVLAHGAGFVGARCRVNHVSEFDDGEGFVPAHAMYEIRYGGAYCFIDENCVGIRLQSPDAFGALVLMELQGLERYAALQWNIAKVE